MKTNTIAQALIFILFFASVKIINAQGFEKNYGGTSADQGYAVTTTSDGKFIMAGYTSSYGNGGNDIMVIKTSATGKLLWCRVIGGAGDDMAWAIARESNDNIIVAGQTNSYGGGNNDIYLVKLSKNGNVIWTKTIGGAGNDYAKGVLIYNGNYFIAGATSSSGAGGSDMYFLKTDTSGNIIWSKTYGYAGDDYANTLEKTYDGKFVLAGRTANFGISSPVYVVKVKANGDTIWTKNYFSNNNSNTGSAANVKATSIKELNNHSYILTGFGYPYNGGYGNMFHLKIDGNGTLVYLKWSGLLADGGNAVTKTSDSGYVVCTQYCNYGCRIRLIKYNAAGTMQWQHDYLPGLGLTYNEYSNGLAIKELPNKGFIVTGYTAWTKGINDVLLVKTDSLGNSNTYTAPTITASGATNFCTGGSVILTAPAGYTSYKWIKVLSNAVTWLDTSIAINVSSSGAYYCVMTNDNGIFVSSVITIGVTNLPVATVTANGSLNFCAASGQSLTLTAPAGYAYQWKLNGTNITGATASSYNVTSPGSYTVSVSNTCGTATSNASVVNSSFSPSSSINCVSGSCMYPPTCEYPEQAQLQVSNYGTGTTYNWLLNGTLVSSGTANIFYPTQPGNYTCAITNSCGSSTSTPFNVLQTPFPSYQIMPGGNTSGCGITSVVLNSPYGFSGYYQWYLNNNLIPGAIDPSYIATQSGDYTVDFDTYNCGIETTDPLYVGISGAPASTISASGATQICSGSVTLTANTAGAGVNYSWAKDGVYISGASAQTYNATVSGSYACNVYNPACGNSYSNSINVSIGPPTGTVNIASSSICSGNSTTVYFNTARPGYSYQWKLNGTNIAGANSSTYSATVAGSYTCVVTNSCNTFTSNAVSLTVNPTPSQTVTVTGSTALCPGASVNLTAAAGTGYTYQWFKGNYYISGATSQSYSANSAGTYYAKVTAPSGCSSFSNPYVTVTTAPLPVATIKSTDYPQICSGATITLKTTSTAGYSYQWLKNGTTINGATDSVYVTGNGGNYSVNVSNACGTVTTGIIKITKIANPPAVATANGPTTFCSGNSVVLSANTGTSYSYQWTKNGTEINGAINQNYTAATQGTYRVNVTNGSGCSASSTGIIVTVPCKLNGSESENTFDVNIYPNPSDGDFVFELENSSAEKTTITIYDISGRMIQSDITYESQFVISNSQLNSGIYFAEINNGNSTKKLKLLKLNTE